MCVKEGERVGEREGERERGRREKGGERIKSTVDR